MISTAKLCTRTLGGFENTPEAVQRTSASRKHHALRFMRFTCNPDVGLQLAGEMVQQPERQRLLSHAAKQVGRPLFYSLRILLTFAGMIQGSRGPLNLRVRPSGNLSGGASWPILLKICENPSFIRHCEVISQSRLCSTLPPPRARLRQRAEK